MYAMLATRPDLATAVSFVCKYLSKPKPTHVKLVKHILKYLKANPKASLHYTCDSNLKLTAYADASYAIEENYVSRTGFCILVGDGLLSWASNAQSVVAQSSAEAEYYAAVAAANEVVWFKQLLSDVGYPQDTVPIYEDNQACIALSKNPQDHKRTKHIQVKYHVLRDYVINKVINLIYCPTVEQYADIFTKGVPGRRLRKLLHAMGLSRTEQS